MNNDEHLRNNGGLEVDGRVQVLIIAVNLTRQGVQTDVELVVEVRTTAIRMMLHQPLENMAKNKVRCEGVRAGT